MRCNLDITAALRREFLGGRSVVLATLVATKGSTYRKAGARALFCSTGAWVGLISGGCLEADLGIHAAELFEAALAKQENTGLGNTGLRKKVTYDLRSNFDIVMGMGLGCEGYLEIELEVFIPQQLNEVLAFFPLAKRCVVFGAGEDSKPLIEIVSGLGFSVSLVDRRPGVLEQYPNVSSQVEKFLWSHPHSLAIPPADVYLFMNHHFETDCEQLQCLLASDYFTQARYVGLLGPVSRREKIFACVPEARLHFPHLLKAPAGLHLGGDEPSSIALSVVAEIFSVLHETDGTPLWQKHGPIHS